MSETEFDPDEYDLTIVRTLDMPRERVWEAWTDPEQVAQWWGPEGFTVPRCEMDVRPDGAFRIDVAAPDGTVSPSEGMFDEVEEPERLVLTGRAVEGDDGSYQMEVRQTVTFEERGDRTELTLEAEVVSATPDAADALDGMEDGWSQSLEKLAEYVAPRWAYDDTDVESTDTSLTVRRTFDAPRECVYRAFAGREKLEQWFAPGDLTPEVHTLELEPGGEFTLSFVGEETRTDIEGTYVEVVENERIVHTWNYPGEDESRVTYEFRNVDGGTEVVLTHENVGPYRDRSASENVDGYVEGWSSALEELEVTLEDA